MPLESVVSVSVAVEFEANVPLAPEAGAVKVTVTPLIGFESLSTTVACSCVENAVLTTVVCGVPAVALTADGAPAVLVRL
jgi:hypothetical protein